MGMRRGQRPSMKDRAESSSVEAFDTRLRVEDMEELATRPAFAHVKIERTGESQGANIVGIRVYGGGRDMGPFYREVRKINPLPRR